MNFIVAVTQNYAIGRDNKLLFNLPQDLAYFKQTTLNKVVIMGEKTYFSLPKRPLPNRTNIVLSDNPNFFEEGIIIVRSLKELLDEVKKYNEDDVYVCGGASVYNLLMQFCNKAYITKIEKQVPADTYINNIEKMGNWKEISSSPEIEENGIKFKFKVFQNLEPKSF